MCAQETPETVHSYGSVSGLPCLVLYLKLFWFSGSVSFPAFFLGGQILLPQQVPAFACVSLSASF